MIKKTGCVFFLLLFFFYLTQKDIYQNKKINSKLIKEVKKQDWTQPTLCPNKHNWTNQEMTHKCIYNGWSDHYDTKNNKWVI